MKKYFITLGIVLALGALVLGAVPAMASGNNSADTTSAEYNAGRHPIRRFLGIQDESRVDELLTRAVENGRLTEEQSAKIKEAWVEHHEEAGKINALGRLLIVRDESRVDQLLQRAVDNGKITAEQSAKIKQAWLDLHGE
jgi:polyhydroxyalkanoate synthesis regulator phasin